VPGGLQLVSDNLVNELYSEKLQLRTTDFSLTMRAPTASATDDPRVHPALCSGSRVGLSRVQTWVEVSRLAGVSVGFSKYQVEGNWEMESRRQIEYLRRLDAGSHRLPFLWDGMSVIC
jgi:hypothetical protein